MESLVNFISENSDQLVTALLSVLISFTVLLIIGRTTISFVCLRLINNLKNKEQKSDDVLRPDDFLDRFDEMRFGRSLNGKSPIGYLYYPMLLLDSIPSLINIMTTLGLGNLIPKHTRDKREISGRIASNVLYRFDVDKAKSSCNEREISDKIFEMIDRSIQLTKVILIVALISHLGLIVGYSMFVGVSISSIVNHNVGTMYVLQCLSILAWCIFVKSFCRSVIASFIKRRLNDRFVDDDIVTVDINWGEIEDE